LEVLDGHFIFLYQHGSPEILKTSFHVELDVAKATWLSHDIVMFSSKNGEILLLTVVYDGRYGTITYCSFEKIILTDFTSVLNFVLIIIIVCFFVYRAVQRLDLMKSKASVLSSVGYLCTCCSHVPLFCPLTEGLMFLCLCTCLL
jgi:hypothetical protein